MKTKWMFLSAVLILALLFSACQAKPAATCINTPAIGSAGCWWSGFADRQFLLYQ